jgi:hypothetical protein
MKRAFSMTMRGVELVQKIKMIGGVRVSLCLTA